MSRHRNNGHRHGHREMIELVNELNALPGWVVEDRPKGYIVFPPEPARPFTIPHRPRDPARSRRNKVAQARRAGAPL